MMLSTAMALLSDPQPHTRHQAMQVLTALAAATDSATGTNCQLQQTAGADAIFQRLCVVAATDTVERLRLQALQALAGMHHASTAIKLQALSKKATLRVLVPASNTPQQQQPAASAAQPPAKKQKQQEQQSQSQGDTTGLLDAATGALVHGTEDDVPRVRLAAVGAIVSLSSRDTLFADAAGALLSDLVGDQLLEVRQAVLQALLAQASAFQQRQQQQQQGQQQGQLTSEADGGNNTARGDAGRGGDGAGGWDADMPDAPEDGVLLSAAQEQESARQQACGDDDDKATPGAGAGAAGGGAGGATQSNQAQQQPQQQQQGQQLERRRNNKPRKSDLPPWGKDALLAAVAALSDSQAVIRELALRLLQLLPPANVPDLVAVINSLAVCCERYGRRTAFSSNTSHMMQLVWGLVEQLGGVRAEMITLAPAKLVPMLAHLAVQQQQHPCQAAAAAAVGAGATQGVVAVDSAAATPATPAAAAAATVTPAAGGTNIPGVDTSAAAAGGGGDGVGDGVLPLGAQVLTRLLLAGVQQRKQGLSALLRELQRAKLLKVPALQPWLASIQALQQQQQQEQQQPPAAEQLEQTD